MIRFSGEVRIDIYIYIVIGLKTDTKHRQTQMHTHRRRIHKCSTSRGHESVKEKE